MVVATCASAPITTLPVWRGWTLLLAQLRSVTHRQLTLRDWVNAPMLYQTTGETQVRGAASFSRQLQTHTPLIRLARAPVPPQTQGFVMAQSVQ